MPTSRFYGITSSRYSHNALTLTNQDSLNVAAGGNLLTKTPRDDLTIIENKSKVCNSRNKPVVTKVRIFSSSFLERVEKSLLLWVPHPYHQCLATDGNAFPEYQDDIQGYVSAAAVNYNQGNTGYRPQSVANQIRSPGCLEAKCSDVLKQNAVISLDKTQDVLKQNAMIKTQCVFRQNARCLEAKRSDVLKQNAVMSTDKTQPNIEMGRVSPRQNARRSLTKQNAEAKRSYEASRRRQNAGPKRNGFNKMQHSETKRNKYKVSFSRLVPSCFVIFDL
ncbi:hypothetical protein Tco_0776863 [Tanacetum coccineum]